MPHRLSLSSQTKWKYIYQTITFAQGIKIKFKTKLNSKLHSTTTMTFSTAAPTSGLHRCEGNLVHPKDKEGDGVQLRTKVPDDDRWCENCSLVSKFWFKNFQKMFKNSFKDKYFLDYSFNQSIKKCLRFEKGCIMVNEKVCKPKIKHECSTETVGWLSIISFFTMG